MLLLSKAVFQVASSVQSNLTEGWPWVAVSGPRREARRKGIFVAWRRSAMRVAVLPVPPVRRIVILEDGRDGGQSETAPELYTSRRHPRVCSAHLLRQVECSYVSYTLQKATVTWRLETIGVLLEWRSDYHGVCAYMAQRCRIWRQ